MDPNQEIDNPEITFELADDDAMDESGSVDDFIRELEAKEKDLHITAETTFIELAADFPADEVPDFIRQELQDGQKSLKPAAGGPNSTVDRTAVLKLEGEVKNLKAKVADLQEERSELYKNSQRRLKDFESFKARTERERSETFQRQLTNLATQMLPVLDNLDRALQFAGGMPEEKSSGFAQFFDGIVLVNQQVHEVLGGMGIVPIATVGEEFDPHFHEAVAVDEESDLPPNTVTFELLRGFRIGNNVIRHSMVRVSKAAAPAEAPPETERETSEEAQTFGDAPTQDLEGQLPAAAGYEEPAVGQNMIPEDGSRVAEARSDNAIEIERNGETAGTVDDRSE